MVGIGTSDVNLDKYRHTFCSLLGKDEESWGLSYTGSICSVLVFACRNSCTSHLECVMLLHNHIFVCVCLYRPAPS